MTGPQLQKALFQQLRREVPQEQNLVSILSDILQLSPNAVYKRLKGTTPLSLEDLTRLAEKFRFPFDSLIYPELQAFSGEFSGFGAPLSCLEYLRLLEDDLKTLRQVPAPHLWYVTTGLPDFYYFFFEELTLFQAWVWERMVWNSPAWQDQKFSFDHPDKEELLSLTKRLAHQYCHIPTTEIWSEGVLDNLLHQVHYAANAFLFENPDDIFALYRQAHLLIDHLEAIAGNEKRFPPNGASQPENPAGMQLFYNEIMQSNIFALVETGEAEVVYSVLNNPNFIRTSDTRMVSYARSMIQKLLRRAQPMGRGGEKFRGIYFGKLRSRVQFSERKIKAV